MYAHILHTIPRGRIAQAIRGVEHTAKREPGTRAPLVRAPSAQGRDPSPIGPGPIGLDWDLGPRGPKWGPRAMQGSPGSAQGPRKGV